MKILATVIGAALLVAASMSTASAAVSYVTVTDWTTYDLSDTDSLAGGYWQTTPTSDPGELRWGSQSGLYRSPFDGSGAAEDPAPGYIDNPAAAQAADRLPYWAIGPNNPLANADNQATLVFDTARDGFSFVWGSVDSYNSVTFVNSVTSASLLVNSLVLSPGGFPQTLGAIFVTVTDFVFDRVIFKSLNSEALEVGLFASVPLPAGVLLLGSGLAGLGFLGWRRKRTATPAAA